MKNKFVLVITLFLFQYTTAFAKQVIKFKIQFDIKFKTDKLMMLYNNGYGNNMIKLEFLNNIAYLKDTIEAFYSSLVIVYPNNNGTMMGVEILINEESAFIYFKQPKDSMNNWLSTFNSKGIFIPSKTKEYNRIRQYTQKETSAQNNYSNQYQKFKNDSSLILYNEAFEKLALKEMEYIKTQPKKYFFFWHFYNSIVPVLKKTKSVELYEYLNTNFSTKYSNSFEGNNIKKLLLGILNVKEGNLCPFINSKDIIGNKIKVDNNNSKPVLLCFWAIWCMPCIAEIPLIKDLSNKFDSSKLQIISVSYDSKYSDYIIGVGKYKMNWTHIFNDKNVINSYGNKPIPSIYLIDKNGKIIFSSWETEISKLESVITEVVK